MPGMEGKQKLALMDDGDSPNALYKYLPARYVSNFVEQGVVLFRNLAYFARQEDQARGDIREGLHVDHPDNDVTITDATGKLLFRGDLSYINSVDLNRLFAFCLSEVFDENLFDAFSCDACVRIIDCDTFLMRCKIATRKAIGLDKTGLLHRRVNYYEPNQEAQNSIKDPRNVPFFKTQDFSYQREYRLVVGLPGAFSLTERIVVPGSPEDPRSDCAQKPAQKKLHIGNISGLVQVHYRS